MSNSTETYNPQSSVAIDYRRNVKMLAQNVMEETGVECDFVYSLRQTLSSEILALVDEEVRAFFSTEEIDTTTECPASIDTFIGNLAFQGLCQSVVEFLEYHAKLPADLAAA